jgi:hypothetical protein
VEGLSTLTLKQRKIYLELLRNLIVFQLPEAVQQLGLEGAEESVLELIEQKKIIVAYNGETKRCWLEMTEEIKW